MFARWEEISPFQDVFGFGEDEKTTNKLSQRLNNIELENLLRTLALTTHGLSRKL